MKNIILLFVLAYASFSQAALTRIPGTQLGVGAVASQGATAKVDIQSVYFGASADCSTPCTTGSCTICNRVGSKITSVSFSVTGNYDLNGIDGTKYNCSGTAYAGGSSFRFVLHNRVSSTTSLARITLYDPASSPANGGYASITCVGIP